MLKRIGWAFLVMALAWGVFRHLQYDSLPKIKIGFIVKQPEEPWFQLEWQFASIAAEELGFELIKIGAPDGEKVLSALDVLAAHGAKGVVICVPDVLLGPAVVRRSDALGLKLMSVDDQFVDAHGQVMQGVHHLGISAKEIGRGVGRNLLQEMQARGFNPEKTRAVAITFDELPTARERTDGASEALIAGGFHRDRILAAPTKTTDQGGGFDAINVLIAKHPDIEHWLVYSLNDNVVMGGVRAFEGHGKKYRNVIGIGINGTDGIGEFKKKEPTGFYGSMLLSAKDHGFRTAEMMFRWIKDGVEPPLDSRTTGVLITRENYQTVLKEHGISNF